MLVSFQGLANITKSLKILNSCIYITQCNSIRKFNLTSLKVAIIYRNPYFGTCIDQVVPVPGQMIKSVAKLGLWDTFWKPMFVFILFLIGLYLAYNGLFNDFVKHARIYSFPRPLTPATSRVHRISRRMNAPANCRMHRTSRRVAPANCPVHRTSRGVAPANRQLVEPLYDLPSENNEAIAMSPHDTNPSESDYHNPSTSYQDAFAETAV